MSKSLERKLQQLVQEADTNDLDSLVYLDDNGCMYVWTRERGIWLRVNGGRSETA